MKKVIFSLIVFYFNINSVYSQVEFGFTDTIYINQDIDLTYFYTEEFIDNTLKNVSDENLSLRWVFIENGCPEIWDFSKEDINMGFGFSLNSNAPLGTPMLMEGTRV